MIPYAAIGDVDIICWGTHRYGFPIPIFGNPVPKAIRIRPGGKTHNLFISQARPIAIIKSR